MFLLVSLGSVGCSPGTPQGPACHASHAGLLCSWKVADSLGSALAEPSAWLETPLILSQHNTAKLPNLKCIPFRCCLTKPCGKWRGTCWRLPWPCKPEWELGRLLLAREVPAVDEAVSGERQGGREQCCASGLWLGIKQPSLAPEWLGCAGAQIPGKTLSLPLAGSGSPPWDIPCSPPAVLCSKAVLSWLCCTLGGSPASWRAALLCCREAKYICLATNQGAV